MNVEHEVGLLIDFIKKLGTKGSGDVLYSVKFGVLFDDDECANVFEALMGTLKAAKKRKVITYEGELLMKGMSDNVDIKLLKETL